MIQILNLGPCLAHINSSRTLNTSSFQHRVRGPMVKYIIIFLIRNHCYIQLSSKHNIEMASTAPAGPLIIWYELCIEKLWNTIHVQLESFEIFKKISIASSTERNKCGAIP